MKTTLRYWNLLLAAVVSLLVGAVPANAATRVALISGDGGEPVANLVDLAQVQLSREAGLELLDRALIRRVLDEQKLSLSGAVDASQAIAVGKVLKVDLIAVVESSPGKDGVLGVVIFDAQTGIRFWNTALPEAAKELERQAEEVVKCVQIANRKRERRTQGGLTVGVLTVRNADLPRSQDGLCETVGLLIERGLSRSPDLAVLERRRLAHVNAERAIPVAEPNQELLASLTTIDLEISRGDGGRGLKGTALLKRAGAEQAQNVTVSIAESNEVLLAETLLKKLIEALQAAPAVASADSKLEARRFDGEAAHHYSHKRYGDAVRAADAAVALDPANEDFGDRLCVYLVRYATFLFWPERLDIIQGGDRAWMDAHLEDAVLETVLANATRALEINSRLPGPKGHWLSFNQPLSHLGDRLRGLCKASSSPKKERLDMVLQACRQRSLDYIAACATKAEADPKMLDRYMMSTVHEIGVIKSCSIDSEQYSSLIYKIAERWLAVTKDWQPQFSQSDRGDGLNALLDIWVEPAFWPWPVNKREFYQKMAPLFVVMQQHSRPIVRLYGVRGQIRADVLLGKESEEKGYQRFADEYRKLAEAIVTAPEPWDTARTRHSVYSAWANAISHMPGESRGKFVERELIELCHFMVLRKELELAVLPIASGELAPRKALEVIRLMLTVVDSKNVRDAVRLRSELLTAEQTVLRRHPELSATSIKPPWSKATKVFEAAQFRLLSEIAGLTIVNETVYCLCFQFEGDRSALRLVRVPLSGGDATLMAKVDLNLSAKTISPYRRSGFISSICSDGQAIYVGTDGAGIAVFPMADGAPRRIALEDGLPGNRVRSVAMLDGKIYAGVEEGYLMAYDLERRRCDVLASSRRKQKLSPFDDQKSFHVPLLVADTARQRLVFVIGDSLWQLTPADGHITQILNLVAVDHGRWVHTKLNDENISWVSPVRRDRVLVSSAFHAIEIDLARDRATVIHSPDMGLFPINPPHLVVDGFLWSGGSFARLSLDKREHTSLPAPDHGPNHFDARFGLELVNGGKQILAADSRTLWLLDVGAKASAADTPEVGSTSKPIGDAARTTTPKESTRPQ